MELATPKSSYSVLLIDENFNVIPESGDDDEAYECIDQPLEENLEVWKERPEDGFYFVFSNDLGIGYWDHPRLITLTNSIKP